MIGPEDLEDSPPPADEIEDQKVEEIGEVKEVDVEVEKEEAEVVSEVEGKGDAEEVSKNVEEVVQVANIEFIPLHCHVSQSPHFNCSCLGGTAGTATC